MKTTVVVTLEALSATDIETADRAGLEAAVRSAGDVRAWLDAFDVRCSRRSRQLAAEGRAGAPESTLTDHGRRSGRDAAAAADREAVCNQMGSFEEALAAGEVSAGHVDALARATKRLDDDTMDAVVDMEADLVDAAGSERVEIFERRVRDTIKHLQSRQARSDAEELDRQRARSTIKRWTDKKTGMRHTHLELDPLRDHALWSTLDLQVNRARQHDANKLKPWPQLQIDTLIDTLTTGARNGGHRTDTNGDSPSSTSHRGTNGSRDTGSGTDRTGDDCCTCGGQPADASYRVPEATVLVDLATLTSGLHANSICELDDGTPLPISTMRRLLCDCEVLPAVLGTRGETLEQGRSTRTATRPQRRALRAMYRSCAHPDCTVAFNACRIHHITWWWRHLGPTDLDNLLPLCERHHHLVHEGRWTLTMTADRVTTWTRPDGTTAHHGTSINRAPNGIHAGRGSGRDP